MPVLISDGAGTAPGRITFDTKDVSVSGAFLTTGLLLEVDEVVGLELKLDERRALKARARVVRVSKSPPGMGIAFVDLADKDRDALRALVQQRGIKKS
jgi:hypothetical protein